ncbi:hypothetical protein RvY_07829 [Ramazzottius varieornatus]|uniref:Uncharacterized protein n=1 Tax=Ramazzottius varieornatus TaxID=947166 RepID=A0A1D1VBW6_RAMVA|nr:hypothetical protein RvY_07829 [Ramazzottius varieornatus]
MASMLNNVLGYLCSKTSDENCQVVPEVTETRDGPERTSPDLCDPDDSKNVQYDIEDQDGWQIVCRANTRREPSENPSDADADEGLFALAEEEDEDPVMDNVESWKSRAAAWYLAPPPCFTRSAPCPTNNPFEDLLLEHPSMSVYLLPVAATARQAGRLLYQSAPPVMEEDCPSSRDTPDDQGQLAVVPVDENTAPVVQRKGKRKRRTRRTRQSSGATTNFNAATPAVRTALGETNLMAEADKQLQHEETELRTWKKALSRKQVRRSNRLTRVNIPKNSTVREGNYRCLQ